MRIFLDVEGTLIVHARRGGCLVPRPADHLEEFLGWALGVAECFWLSGVDRTGSHEGILRAFRSTLDPIRYQELQPILLAIRPTYWSRSKLEVIDLESRDWAWIDDAHGLEELDILRARGLQDHAVVCPHNGLREVRKTIEETLLKIV